MKIKFLRNVSVGGKSYAVGDIEDVSDRDARLMISIGKAQPESGDPGRDPAQTHLKDDPEAVQTREPKVLTRDPKPKAHK